MPWYRLQFQCPHCGHTHGIGLQVQIDQTLPCPGTLADLLHDLIWCGEAGDYIEVADPARVLVTPWADADW